MTEFKSFISSNINIYDRVHNDIKTDDVCCALTLVNITENDYYFNWIHIPIDENIYKTYNVDELYKYMSMYEYKDIPDPYRIYPKIDFMINRVILYKSVKEDANLLIKDIDDKMRTSILKNILSQYIEGCIYDKANKLASIVNIKTLLDNNIIFNINAKYAEKILTDKAVVKSFIIRTSSCSQFTDNLTIFSISYLKDNNQIIHLRFIDVHGIGIYNTNENNKKYYENLTKNDFLEDINYGKPLSSSIMDLLILMHSQKSINIGNIITNE